MHLKEEETNGFTWERGGLWAGEEFERKVEEHRGGPKFVTPKCAFWSM